MRTLLICSMSLLWIVPALAQGSGDDAAIRMVVQKYLDARQERNAQAVTALFTPDADQLVSSGEWRKGREALVKGAMASSERTGGHRTITVESVRYITPEIAIADGRYELSGLKGGQTRKMWSTFVMRKTGSQWRIAAIRNMLPAAPAPAK